LGAVGMCYMSAADMCYIRGSAMLVIMCYK